MNRIFVVILVLWPCLAFSGGIGDYPTKESLDVEDQLMIVSPDDTTRTGWAVKKVPATALGSGTIAADPEDPTSALRATTAEGLATDAMIIDANIPDGIARDSELAAAGTIVADEIDNTKAAVAVKADTLDASAVLVDGNIPASIARDAEVTSAVAGKLDTPTGTPDGSKFARDDGTWAVPPGGGSTIIAGVDPTQAAVAESLIATFELSDTNIPEVIARDSELPIITGKMDIATYDSDTDNLIDDSVIPSIIARDTELFDAATPGEIGAITPAKGNFTEVAVPFVDGSAALTLGNNTAFESVAGKYQLFVEGGTLKKNLDGVESEVGGGGAAIDDTAGAGDTTVAYSADKVTSLINGVSGSSVTASVVEALYALHDTTAPVISSLAASPTTQNGTETAISLSWANTETNPQQITWTSEDGGSGTLAGTATSLNHTISAGRTQDTDFTLTPRDWAGQTGTAQTVTVSYDAGQAYDFEENFETPTTGFEGSWATTGTPNPANATSPLRGAQSLTLESSSDTAETTLTEAPELWVAFRVSFASTATGDVDVVQFFDDTDTRSISFRVRSDGTFAIYSPGGSNINGTTVMAANTTYYVWLHWKKGTGDAGTDLYVSTTRARPASPEVTRDTWSYDINVGAIKLLRGSGPNVKFDQFIYDSASIGDLDE